MAPLAARPDVPSRYRRDRCLAGGHEKERHLPCVYPCWVRARDRRAARHVANEQRRRRRSVLGRAGNCASALSLKGPRRRSGSPNVVPVMKRRAATRWTPGGIAAAGAAPAAAQMVMVPAGGWLARHDLGSAREPSLQTARDVARGRLLALSAGLLAAAALACAARNVALSRQRRVTGRCAKKEQTAGRTGPVRQVRYRD